MKFPPNKNSLIKPVAQLKTSVSAQSLKRPVAPAVYRPQAVPRVLQAKTHPGPQPATISKSNPSSAVVQRALAVGGGGGGLGGGGGGGDKGFTSDHWQAGHHKGDSEYVERNINEIAQTIINWASAQGLVDDTKIVVNFDLGGGGWGRYFIVVVFYHTGPPAYINFHSCRRSDVQGNAVGEPNTQVYSTRWRDKWK